MKKKLFESFLWAVILLAAIQVQSSEISSFLSEKSKFNTDQITQVNSLIESAINEKLPEDYLVLRVREGVAKNVSFEILSEVIKEKIITLKVSTLLLNSRFEVKDMNKGKVKLLAEYLDRGLTINSFNELTREAKNKKVSLDRTLELLNIFVILKEKNIDRKYAAAVFVSMLGAEFSSKQFNESADLFSFSYAKSIEFNEAREIIIDGIKAGKSLSEIKGLFRKKILKEIKEEMKEYDKDKRPLEGTR